MTSSPIGGLPAMPAVSGPLIGSEVRVKLQQIEIFLVVAEELHFRRAAELLFIQPSTVSSAISSLERELGSALFERTSRNVELTPTGVAFRSHAETVITAVADAKRAALAAASPTEFTLRVGLMDEGLGELNQIVLANYEARFPNASIEMVELPYDALGPDLLAENIDAFTCGFPLHWIGDPRLATRTPLFIEGRVLIVPARHRFAERATLEIDEVVTEPFLRIDGLPPEIDAFFACERYRDPAISPDVRVAVASMANILNNVAAGRGLYTVTDATRRYYPHPDVRYVPVPALPSAGIFVVHRSSEDRPHVLAFAEEARRAAETSLELIPTASLLPVDYDPRLELLA